MATNTNGLFYYKLDVNTNGYPGDITKNCGLRGEEIDGNFHFLRGHDIQNIGFDEQENLLLTRYNGEVLTAKKTEKPDYNFSYNPQEGVLTVITPDGEEILVEGFLTSTVNDVYHDSTLSGNGQENSPLSLSNIAKTGQYRPAKGIIDLTNSDNHLPSENLNVNDIYVTKEQVNHLGRLYSFDEVCELDRYLKEINSAWRVPTKADWDELLNKVDCETPNHNLDTVGYLGEFAGAALKSTYYWKKSDSKLLSDNYYGFSVMPVGYADKHDNYKHFGSSAAFWTTTLNDDGNSAYVKLFNYDDERVKQDLFDKNHYLSVRLVRDYKDNEGYNKIEYIGTDLYDCFHMPDTNLVWTNYNVSLTNDKINGLIPTEWETISVDVHSYGIRYFINSWNGSSWDKHEMNDGESIVISTEDSVREWILMNNDLVKYADLLHSELDSTFKELLELCNALQTELVNTKSELSLTQKQLESLQSELITLQQSAITSIQGTNNEITVTVNNNIATVGFAEDTYFIAGE